MKQYGVVGRNDFAESMTPNNVSRRIFADYVKKHNLERIGNTNAFKMPITGEICGFSVAATNEPECRQFGEHYDHLMCMFPDGSVKSYRRDELKIGNLSRLSPSGVKYYSVRGVI